MSDDPIYKNFKNVLKGAKEGLVVTRFPPEPSGFLHIGHVKAAMLNYHYAKMYKGKMILRFDDTNPMNEKIEFVENIIRDLKTLDIVPDEVTHTSDHFPVIVEYMEKMINEGNAYADNGSGEEMKNQRDNGIESEHRKKSPEENLKIFKDMLEGKAEGWCIRGKMNMQDKFKCLRDPVFYRCKNESHHRHGTKYKAYPTYDFACPIVDAIEGVTHALRTIEYHDRNGGYAWVQKVLGLRSVVIYDYSRLNLVSTILSKRSLKWFVEENIADGWNDPRFPTVQGIMRRGMTPGALKRFMLEQGPSKNTNLMEWDKLWAYNKDVVDSKAARYTAIVKESQASIVLDNFDAKITIETHPLHPKNPALGTKPVLFGKTLIVEKEDVRDLKVDEKITLMKWGNAIVKKVEEKDGTFVVQASLKLDDKDFKKTKKLTWIAKDETTNFEVTLVELDHLITKKKVEENESVKDIVNKNSYISYTAIAEGCAKEIQQGSIIQLERRGFFFIDKLETMTNKMTMNFVPDGKSKNMSKIESKLDQKQVAGGKSGPVKEEKKKEQKIGEDGEVILSKKELNKLKKKQQKAAFKDGSAAPQGYKGDPSKAKKGSQAAQAKTEDKGELVYDSSLNVVSAKLNKIEKDLLKSAGNFLSGSQPTSLDKEAFEGVAADLFKVSPLSHPHTFAWCNLVAKFPKEVMEKWATVSPPEPEFTITHFNETEATAADDDLDLFGDDDEADAAAAKAIADKNKEKAKKKKAPKAAMSLVMLEVKPLDDTINLDELAAKCFSDITQDGLFWKTEFKKEPVAFGIFKLIIGFSLEDDKVSVDDIVEKIEQFEELVQSVEIMAFNKI